MVWYGISMGVFVQLKKKRKIIAEKDAEMPLRKRTMLISKTEEKKKKITAR